MSAFLVTDTHINAMLRYYHTRGRHPASYYHEGSRVMINDWPEAGQLLVDQNYSSVYARYEGRHGATDQAHAFKYRVVCPMYSAVEIIKACDCYNYQACDTGDYYQSKAHSLVDAIRECAIDNLPGYDEAQYEILEPPLAMQKKQEARQAVPA